MRRYLLQSFILALYLTYNSLPSYGFVPPAKSFIVYFKCIQKPHINLADTINISYNVNYPFIEFIRDRLIIPSSGVNKIVSIRTKAHTISINYRRLFINPNDTISFSIGNHGSIILHGADTLFYNFGIYNNHPFYSKNEMPFNLLSDTLNIENYTAYCKDFYKKEQNYIDSVFGKKKIPLKTYFLQKSSFDFIDNLIKGYQIAGLSKDDLISITSLKEVKLLQHPYALYDYAYRIALGSYIKLIVGPDKDKTTPDKMIAMLDASKKALSIDAQQYLRLSLLNQISNISKSEYDRVTKRIYKELFTSSKFTNEETAKIKAVYNNALIMSKKLKDFSSIKMKKVNDEIVELKDVVQPGKFLLIDFWASWCRPCVEEIPFLKQLSINYPELQVISISIDESKQA